MNGYRLKLSADDGESFIVDKVIKEKVDINKIADWFETLAKAERSHANRFQKALDNLDA